MERYHSLFRRVEDQFDRYIGYYGFLDANRCCSVKERDMILFLVPFLWWMYPHMTCKDLVITLMYLYFSLTLGEQTEDRLRRSVYTNYADDPEAVTRIYYELSTQDVLLEGWNLGSGIRQALLFGKIKVPKRFRERWKQEFPEP